MAEQNTRTSDPAHDFLHVSRVVSNARVIAIAEGGDLAVVVPAALLHELFNYPKNHPDSHLSGELCAEQAADLLEQEGYGSDLIARICYCIRVHSFSRGILPETLEARILQDADRLDALGAIGIARCFSTGATMRTAFYAPDDPFCRHREPEDKRYSLDHFYFKLLKVPHTLYTQTARILAKDRVAFLELFLKQMEAEIAPIES